MPCVHARSCGLANSNSSLLRATTAALAFPLAFPLAFALAFALALLTPEARAQDAPWTGKDTTKKPVAKRPVAKKPAAKKPAAKPAKSNKLADAAATSAAVDDSIDDAPPAGLRGLLKHFYQELAPHGQWIQHDTYGLVWLPAEKEVGKAFTPYRSDGRWAATEKGDWAWVSDKDWGNIPFHYGRWIWTPDDGWAWIPGRDHAPAWVVWRLGEPGTDHVGWAPMAPSYYWIDGAPERQQTGVLPFWFVPTSKLFSPEIDEHVVRNRVLGGKIYRHSRIFSGHVSEAGLDAPLRVTSPTFEQARMPRQALPKTRLPLDDAAIAPIVLAEAQAATLGVAPALQLEQPGAQSGRFATPPPPRRAASKGRWVRRHQAHDSQRRYRCWWTNTKPRIWRCGY